jgi:hypothetical protein
VLAEAKRSGIFAPAIANKFIEFSKKVKSKRCKKCIRKACRFEKKFLSLPSRSGFIFYKMADRESGKKEAKIFLKKLSKTLAN